MIEIELFPKVSDRNTHSVQSLPRLLKWTTSNDRLKQKTLAYKLWLQENPNATPKEKSRKKVFYFPAVTFGGTFHGTGCAEEINKMSGLIVLDFDHLQNLTEAYNILKSDTYTFLLFVSPSGDGLKVVVKHSLADPQNWQYLYFELESYYKHVHHLETDKSGKDISRMCFLPHMDNIYQNDHCTLWQYSGVFEKQSVAKGMIKLGGCSEPDQHNESGLYEECFYISTYLLENKINIAENYEDWISYGYSLCVLGEKGREIFHKISSISHKYDHVDCDKQYDYMLNHFEKDRTNINNFILNSKLAIAHYTIYKHYGILCR